jgi:hypothetical protein
MQNVELGQTKVMQIRQRETLNHQGAITHEVCCLAAQFHLCHKTRKKNEIEKLGAKINFRRILGAEQGKQRGGHSKTTTLRLGS